MSKRLIKKYSNRNVILIGITLTLFVGFVIIYEVYSKSVETDYNHRYANLMESYFWNYDKSSAHSSLTLILRARGYKSCRLIQPDGKLFLQVPRLKSDGSSSTDSGQKKPTLEELKKEATRLSILEQGLLYLGLIRETTLRSPVKKGPQIIGYLETIWYNRNLYVHLNALFILVLLANIIRYYIKVLEKSRELVSKNDALNNEIAERKRAMEQVQSLKVQQDGDYFLMTLLTKPLGGNHNKSETVSIDFLVNQKKEFTFRKWAGEIGGDICISYSINLNGRPYTAFINGDAMGKSMQGAGGVLVLGSVFQAIVGRTARNAQSRLAHPESWLKYAFLELHTVFESFDGHMLVSCVMGLVDDNSGLVYYINAEHPFTVLYREERAEFIEDSLKFRKLGTSVDTDHREITIEMFQMIPGDVIIMGSDGRDDIVLSQNDNGNNVLNEDEFLFLRNVEKGGGKLTKILENIVSNGAILDDLSLLRVAYLENTESFDRPVNPDSRLLFEKAQSAYRGNQSPRALEYLKEAHEADPYDPDPLRMLLRMYVHQKDYPRALETALKYHELKPEDNGVLQTVAYCYRKVGNVNFAADYGERLRLRKPDHIHNLFNLSRTYNSLGNRQRAFLMLDKIISLEPENEKARRLKEKLYVHEE